MFTSLILDKDKRGVRFTFEDEEYEALVYGEPGKAGYQKLIGFDLIYTINGNDGPQEVLDALNRELATISDILFHGS